MAYFNMDVVFVVVLISIVTFIIKSRLISKLLDYVCSTIAYKKYFVALQNKESNNEKDPSSPLFAVKKKMFDGINAKLKEVPGDILEIGAGSGAAMQWLQLPEGCSMVVVDNNPYFWESVKGYLAKCPDIKLKDYLVQSAVDMSNIPDNTFSVVFVQDVLCSIEEDSLRKMLKEIKRVLKPDGCFFFLEHVLDKPGTLRRIAQKAVTGWLGIWPRLLDNCHCDRETWRYIQETGFKNVNLSYHYGFYPPEWDMAVIMYFIKRFVQGHAVK